MTYTQTGNCPKCGAPIWHPTAWWGIVPPPAGACCGCLTQGTLDSQTERELDELVTLLTDYVGETGKSESAVEVLGRLLEELEGYRRAELARDISEYLRTIGKSADAMSFALLHQPKYNRIPGREIQRIMDELRPEMEAVE